MVDSTTDKSMETTCCWIENVKVAAFSLISLHRVWGNQQEDLKSGENLS